MKKKNFLTQLIITTTLFSLIFFSCKKETSSSGLTPDQEQEVASLSTQSETETEFVFNDVFDNVLGVNAEVGIGGTGVFGRKGNLQNGRETDLDSIPACVTITIARPNAPDLFPEKITIDFGSGCLGKDGHIRSGKIITTYTGRLTVAGKEATTTFEKFKLDSISVQGTHKIKNTTVQGGNQRQFTIDIEDAKLVKPNGNYAYWTSHRVITQVEGNLTPDLALDDVFTITGSAHGKMKQGNDLYAWNSEITEPLRKRFACHWISKGILKVWRETLSGNSKWVSILNYGQGICDAKAELTINGITKEIQLPH
jgi:hypothetical protein